ERVADLFGVKVREGGFSLADDPAFPEAAATYGFASGTSSHADRVATIRDLHERLGVIIDPHTADGVKAAQQWRDQVEGPIVVLETALPVKFAETIEEAIGEVPEVP